MRQLRQRSTAAGTFLYLARRPDPRDQSHGVWPDHLLRCRPERAIMLGEVKMEGQC